MGYRAAGWRAAAALLPCALFFSHSLHAQAKPDAVTEPSPPAVAAQIAQPEINALPSDGRDVSSLALLLPGTAPEASGRGLISFRGLSPILNNNLVDGGNENQEFFASGRGRARAAFTFSQEAVREFRLINGNAAQFSGPAGSVVNVVSRISGREMPSMPK